MKTAIFLGAGASKADGAPLQSEVLRDYFKSDQFQKSSANMDGEIAAFFDFMFGIDVHNIREDVVFPKFEEALGMLDLAKERGESFMNFGEEENFIYTEKIDRLRIYFIFLLAITIGDKVKEENYHKELIKNLQEADLLKDISFVSTNYDLLIDNAIKDVISDCDINYGIENLDNNENSCSTNKKIDLLKVHGSLNWLYCPACNKLFMGETRITVKDKQVWGDFLKCDQCSGRRIPIMVPPTYYKDMTNIYLSTIWHKVEQKLINVDHLVFCGYSFPDADMHIKYLLKRIQVNRPNKTLKITVINDFKDKPEGKRKSEANRYKRFFGEEVDFRIMSFQSFAGNPQEILK